MINKIFLFACLLLVVVIPACKKKQKSEPMFAIVNTNGNPDMNIVVYGSEADYINGVNSVARGFAAGDGSFLFPASKLKVGYWYYVDAYSNDLTFSNWMNGDIYRGGVDSTTSRRFKYSGTFSNYNIGNMPSRTNSMISLFDNNTKGVSRWKAVDAFNIVNGNNIWADLSAAQRYIDITISKSSKCVYYYINGGDTIETPFTLGVVDSFPIYRLIPDQVAANFVMFNSLLNEVTIDYRPVCFDSATALINNNVYTVVKY